MWRNDLAAVRGPFRIVGQVQEAVNRQLRLRLRRGGTDEHLSVNRRGSEGVGADQQLVQVEPPLGTVLRLESQPDEEVEVGVCVVEILLEFLDAAHAPPAGVPLVDALQVLLDEHRLQNIARLDPPPPAEVVRAASKLNYRAFVIVGLIVDRADLFRDNWIYVHSPEVKVGRIQNPKNWSAAMVCDPCKTSLGLEYFCTEGDDIWTMPDAELIALATDELALLGLADTEDVEDGVVLRQPKAYPVYDSEYHEQRQVLRDFLLTIDNLQTIGRNGMHRYNNMDHSMHTGILALQNILGANHDLWEANERDFEEVKRRIQR